jgi:hypothetical protein
MSTKFSPNFKLLFAKRFRLNIFYDKKPQHILKKKVILADNSIIRLIRIAKSEVPDQAPLGKEIADLGLHYLQ